MEVPVINRISDFDVVINDPSLLSRPFAVSGKLHEAYSFWKWSFLLLLAFFASFTSFITRLKSFVLSLRNVDVSLPSTTLVYDYDSDSDSSCSSVSSDDEEEDQDDTEDDSVNGDSRVKRFGYYHDHEEKGINGNIPWMRRSFGDLLSWPDLGGFGSSGVVKLWNNLDINGENGHQNAVASIFSGGVSSWLSPTVVLAEEKKGFDAVEVSAWDARVGFGMPALLAEWTLPGRLLGKIVRVNGGDVDKIYVCDDVGGEITMGDMRMFNSTLMELTESDVNMVRRRRRH